MPNPVVMHQQGQAFPHLPTPFVNPDLTIAIPWYRLLITLWQRDETGAPGDPEQVLNVITSPFVFQAPVSGSIVVSGSGVSDVSVSRDGVVYYTVGLMGQFTLQKEDYVQITWAGAQPSAVWFPGN